MERMWKKCKLCPNETFSSPFQFSNHLRSYHSKIEGGSHVCCYGPNSMCPKLPYEGVSGRDYETHIAKCHIFSNHSSTSSSDNNSKPSTTTSITTTTKNSIKENKHSPDTGDFPKPSPLLLLTGTNDNHDGSSSRLLRDKPNVIDNINCWNIFSASQDLTSILNDPSKSRSYYDGLFTKDWGPYFIETTTITPYATGKKPSQLLFDDYLKKIQKRFKNHLEKFPESHKNNHDIDNDSSSSSSSYRLVPSLFFESDFDLTKNETFLKLLTLFGENENNLEVFLDRNSMNDIQKSLSEYLDVVEQDLSQQICRRSNDFFQVMSSMDVIMEKLKDSIKQVSCIREICHRLKETMILPIQEIAELTKLRSKYRDIYRKINWIATVHQTQPTIQLLLSKNDYAGALDLISTSQEVVAQELNGVISLRYLRLQLMEIEKVIEQMLNEEFVKYLTAEWNRPLGYNHGDNGGEEEEEEDIQKERLLSIIYGMLKLQNFNFIDTFRDEAFTAIKTCIKQTVIEILSFEDNIEVPRIDASLFEQLKCLRFEKWLDCLRMIFDRIVILLKRIVSVYNVINDGFASMTKSGTVNASANPMIPTINTNNNVNLDNGIKVILQGDYLELSSNMKEKLFSICDFAHSNIANIIELRSNDGNLDRIDVENFMQLTKLIEKFINKCELICGRKSPNLKMIFQIQSNRFVSKFHDERKRKLRQLLDLEQWKSVTNVSEDIKILCTKLMDQEDGQESLIEIYSKFKYSSKKSSSTNNGGNYIILNGERFVMVNTVINMIYMILDYCELSEKFSTLSPDILMRLIDLLKSFNSRTSQLILGAEALQVANLKTISARTLMISMRSVIFIQKFIPCIRKNFELNVKNNNNKQQLSLLKHLDELNELFENHYNKIPEKVLGLVKDVIGAHIGKWVAKVPIPSASFQTIAQHLNRLMDNIQDILPPNDLIDLFQKIHWLVMAAFKEQVVIKLKINNDGGPQHGLVTQELAFYVQNMKKLSIGQQLDLSTNDLWPTFEHSPTPTANHSSNFIIKK